MSFYKNYFENIARKHTKIKHEVNGLESFFCIEDWNNTTEISKKLGRQAADAIFILEDFEDGLNDAGADNNRAELFGAFAIITHVSDKRGNKENAKEECRLIAKTIVHKLKFDGVNGPLNVEHIICRMDSRGFAVGPVFNNYWGWRYTFSWMQPENIALNPADWLP